MTKEEYEKKYAENTKITGFGYETTMHFPCPFCAEPDMIVARIVDVEAAMSQDRTCKACLRGVKTIFKHEASGSVAFEVVQTRGEDLPDFLPKIRRIGVVS